MSNNNMPKKVKVGAVGYTVHMLDKKDKVQYGVCIYDHQRIYLSQNMKHQQASDTLLHEVLHAIWNEAGRDHIPELNTETVVRTMATWLRMVIVDNPDFARFIVNAKGSWAHGPTTNPDEVANLLSRITTSQDEEEDD